jgi:hypothetical protein
MWGMESTIISFTPLPCLTPPPPSSLLLALLVAGLVIPISSLFFRKIEKAPDATTDLLPTGCKSEEEDNPHHPLDFNGTNSPPAWELL